MKIQSMYKITILTLIILPLLLMAWKLNQGYFTSKQFIPETKYDVKFNFKTEGEKKEIFIKTYIPQNNLHQNISNVGIYSDGFQFSKIEKEEGIQGEWRNESSEFQQEVAYAFEYQGKELKYKLDPDIKLDINNPDRFKEALLPSEFIQSNHFDIQSKTHEITKGKISVLEQLKSIYQFVYDIPKINTSELTDALSTLYNNEASCNGKSRLFVAMCRAHGIPSRVVGGIILKHEQKKTSHLWAELFIGETWIPFDALNGHFAKLPSNYLELYKGDYFLMSRSSDINFDYLFDIQKKEVVHSEIKSAYTLWKIPSNADIPMSLLKVILLLPLCSLIIALFRNVIGIKTFGVFLPAIITVAIDSVGMGFGIMLYLAVVAVVGLLHYPLTKWGLLYTPKLVIMLVGVVCTLLGMTYIGITYQIVVLSSIIFFPIIILSIAAEKFAKVLMEEGIKNALKIQMQTLIVIILCYAIYQTEFITGFFLTFPEVLSIIVSIMLLLGRWIGLRVSEYKRFSWILS